MYEIFSLKDSSDPDAFDITSLKNRRTTRSTTRVPRYLQTAGGVAVDTMYQLESQNKMVTYTISGVMDENDANFDSDWEALSAFDGTVDDVYRREVNTPANEQSTSCFISVDMKDRNPFLDIRTIEITLVINGLPYWYGALNTSTVSGITAGGPYTEAVPNGGDAPYYGMTLSMGPTSGNETTGTITLSTTLGTRVSDIDIVAYPVSTLLPYILSCGTPSLTIGTGVSYIDKLSLGAANTSAMWLPIAAGGANLSYTLTGVSETWQFIFYSKPAYKDV